MISKILANHSLTALWVFILASALTVITTHIFVDYDFALLEGILIEAHGMLFDILIIGCGLLWLNSKGENYLQNQRYLNEIDDFRGWESEEAARRTRGNILRLNKNGVTKIPLNDCFLRRADLRKANLHDALLRGANWAEACLAEANLSNAVLRGTNLHKADLRGANLENATLVGANLTQARYDSRTKFPEFIQKRRNQIEMIKV